MPIEQLTYAQIAERLGVSSEAARAQPSECDYPVLEPMMARL
jgi:hypothetical protein